MKVIESHGPARVKFTVSLVPRAASNEVLGWAANGHLRVRVTAPPVEGQANLRLIEFLSRLLGIPKRDLTMVSGTRSRTKVLSAPETCKNRLLHFQDI
jgi:uncharacterized protein (TIGR00251 family)